MIPRISELYCVIVQSGDKKKVIGIQLLFSSIVFSSGSLSALSSVPAFFGRAPIAREGEAVSQSVTWAPLTLTHTAVNRRTEKCS